LPNGSATYARSTPGIASSGVTSKPAALAARGGCWFRAGEQELHVGVEEPFAPARKAHPGLVANELAALAERLRAAGHEVRFEESIPGAARFHVADPFGNRLEVRQAEL